MKIDDIYIGNCGEIYNHLHYVFNFQKKTDTNQIIVGTHFDRLGDDEKNTVLKQLQGIEQYSPNGMGIVYWHYVSVAEDLNIRRAYVMIKNI